MTAGFGAIVMLSRRKGRVQNVILYKNIVKGITHPRVEILLQSNCSDTGVLTDNRKKKSQAKAFGFGAIIDNDGKAKGKAFNVFKSSLSQAKTLL